MDQLNNPANFPANAVNSNTSSTYSPQQGLTSSAPPQTLPPLQPQNTAAMQSIYGTHTPRTPGTPGTPGTPAQGSGYATPSTLPPSSRAPYQMMPGNQYATHAQSYNTTSSMLPQTTQAVSHPQPIAPAPASARGTSAAVPPALRPLASGMPGATGMGYSQAGLAPQPPMMGVDSDQPTHVVGSQGRRGILPSAPGRPAAAPAGSAAAKNTVPVKDADGKYPCPHCPKTYLHAKHLKRHLLRHTGDRPYMCVLCRDTFSRSDILKRHFQKCSIRRGNPTGASHLSHPQAHVKKSQQAAQKAALENGGDLSQMNGLTGLPTDGMVHQYGGLPVGEDPNRASRPVGMGGSAYPSDIPTTMNPSVNPQMASYNMPQGQNGMPMFTTGSNSNQQSNVDWAQMFQAGAHNTYVNAFPPNVGQTQIAIKDPSHVDSPDSGAADRSLFFNPSLQPHVNEYCEQLSMRILSFLSPSSSVPNLGFYFSPQNVKDFLAQYTHFHVHLGLLHIPTFRIMGSYTGLVAAICCIGACYSSRVQGDQVREMMDCLRTSLERDSKVFRQSDMQGTADLRPSPNDIEELQALMLMLILCLWNGNPAHRETARRTFPTITGAARKYGLLGVASDLSLYSPLHQPSFNPQGFDIAQFDWYQWAEQEKRLRLMYFILVTDTAMGLYFNLPCQFDGSEIHLPLPADDAAWEAENPSICAESLGLHGPAAAKARNRDGTQRSHQPQLNYCLRALHSRQYDVRPGATNLYGKFILIHALLSQLRRAQMDGHMVIPEATTPLSQNDWIIRTAPGGASGRGTPVSAGQSSTYTVSDVINAVEKFKLIWDSDMMAQFPPPSVQSNPRRVGFCRDAIHFYWVAKYLAKNTAHGDLSIPSEQRFSFIIALLKSVKAWVESDGAARGEEMGSIGTIDKDYGVADLTFDMTRLFTPIPGVAGHRGSGGVGNVNGM